MARRNPTDEDEMYDLVKKKIAQIEGEEGGVAEIDEAPSDVEILEDGGAIITLDDEEEVGESYEFYDNIVGKFEDTELDRLALDLIEKITNDRQARKDKDNMYAEATKRTGLGKEAPGGAEFDGASRAVHPMLTEATFDFSSRSIRELMPPNGPVKMFIPGENITPERLKKADRKKNFMNWQLTVQMPEFRSELEQLLTQLPLGGTMYLRLVPDYSKRRRRPVPLFVPLDFVTIPAAASNYYTAERQCYWEPVTQSEFDKRVAAGMYRDVPRITSQPPEETEAEKAAQKVEGKKEDVFNLDGLGIVCEISASEDLEGDGEAPYLISIDWTSGKIVSIVRNWEEDDEYFDRMQWMVEWILFPWRGAQGVGLGQMIGSLAGAATGALRALLDSALIQNIPTLARLKGANFRGQNQRLNATQVVEIEGGTVGDQDIRKLLMPIPFNGPSETLFKLLGFLTETGRSAIHIALEKLSEDNKNLPVGTTLALIEEGMKVFSAIHLRMFHSMTYVLRILHRIDRMYLTEEELENDVGEVLAYRADFDGPLDCVPTADPEIFSDVQRIAQLQIVADRSALLPEIYNQRAVEKRILERTKIPNPDELLRPEQNPEEMNQVNENVAMSLGRPVTAFPHQDHLAHLQVMLDFALSPVFGMLPVIAPTFLPAFLQHLKEHIVMWYANEYYQMMQWSMGAAEEDIAFIMKQKDPETRAELDRMLAAASTPVTRRAKTLFASIPGIVQQAQQVLEQFTPPSAFPVDPNKAAATQQKREAERLKDARENKKLEITKEAKVIDIQTRAADRDAKKEIDFAKLSAKEREVALVQAQENVREAQEHAVRLEELMMQERAEDERAAANLASEERRNTQDNLTALRIAAAEIESSESVAESTGTGNNPNPSGGRRK